MISFFFMALFFRAQEKRLIVEGENSIKEKEISQGVGYKSLVTVKYVKVSCTQERPEDKPNC